jgi:chloramphenicol 3-O phosphotransferase
MTGYDVPGGRPSKGHQPFKNYDRNMNRERQTNVIVLNGGSSSGKSSIARALQEFLPGIWLTFGVDTFIEALPGRGDSPRSGISYGRGGAVLLSDRYTQLENTWYAGLSSMARTGADIILDEVMLSGRAGQQRLQSAFGSEALTWVGVRCEADVAAAREAARGDREPGMARQQAERVHIGVSYDMEVDTTFRSPEECAQTVADFLKAKR